MKRFPTLLPYCLESWLVSYKHLVLHLVIRVKCTVTKSNVQYSASHELPSEFTAGITDYAQHESSTNKCLSPLVAGVKNHCKKINTQATI